MSDDMEGRLNARIGPSRTVTVSPGLYEDIRDAAQALTEARAEIDDVRRTSKHLLIAANIYQARAEKAESELSTLRARVLEVVGPFASVDFADCRDCTDNNGRPYQSQWLNDALRAARQLMEEVK